MNQDKEKQQYSWRMSITISHWESPASLRSALIGIRSEWLIGIIGMRNLGTLAKEDGTHRYSPNAYKKATWRR